MSTAKQLVEQVKWFSVCMAIAVIAGCGGDSSDPACVDVASRDPRLPLCSGTGSSPGVVQSSIALALVDGSGNAVTTLSPSAPGFAQAAVKDTAGKAAPNVAVTFTTTDKTGGFSPASGTALSDSSGIARVSVFAGNTVGAFTLTASTAGTESGGTVGSGGTTAVGVVAAGSVNLGYAVNTPNLPASSVGSIKFVEALPANLALKGTGGVGRQEFSTLTFQVFDRTGQAVAKARVNFTLNTTVGGLALLPTSAFTDADGKVATVVSAGTMPTPIVTVTATVADSGITTVSNVLAVSTGLAVDSRTSLGVVTGNFEGWDYDGEGTVLVMRMADHFGNFVMDGTAANFTVSHGGIDATCLTGAFSGTTTSIVSGEPGVCRVTYSSFGNRPPGGRAVVLGYVRGEEDFFDANGNNVCDGCANTAGAEFRPADDLKPEIFRDDNEDGRWSPGEPCIGPNLDGACNAPPDGVYNGVLANPKIPDAQQTTYLVGRRQYVAIWSGSHAYITSAQGTACASTGSSSIHVRIVDVNGNPMPAKTTVEFSGPSIAVGATTSYTVANYVLGIGQRFGTGAGLIPIEEYDIPVVCSDAAPLQVNVTTPRGVLTRASIPIR